MLGTISQRPTARTSRDSLRPLEGGPCWVLQVMEHPLCWPNPLHSEGCRRREQVPTLGHGRRLNFALRAVLSWGLELPWPPTASAGTCSGRRKQELSCIEASRCRCLHPQADTVPLSPAVVILEAGPACWKWSTAGNTSLSVSLLGVSHHPSKG